MTSPVDTYREASFSFSNRLARAAWGVCWLLFFRASPRPFHSWRRLVLRLWGAKIARGAHVYPSARIWAPWNLECGEEAGIGDRAIVYNQAKVRIGRRAVISQGTHLCTGTHDYSEAGMPLLALPIVIESQAWIAAECFVMPGIVIGEGAVIGARSVVTKDMPPWTVCAGHPCAAIKPRTNPHSR